MFKSTLKIADIIIQMKSYFPLEPLEQESEQEWLAERFNNFIYTGDGKPDISIEVGIVDKLPRIIQARPLFITYHFQDKSENWRLLKKDKTYIYKSPLETKKQIMVVNEVFNKVNACLLPKSETDASSEKRRAFIKKHRGMVWNITDIIYDFLQVLLINYFAQRNLGIFTHAIGLRDVNGQGFLFAGKSGAGKSTMARLWHKHSKAMVLNDDRVIIRKINRDFFIYGSPWHGEFSDYLASRIESVKLTNLFFIHHSPKNKLRPVFPNEAFKLLYPAVFPTFWDRRCLGNIVYFCQNLVKEISCSKLGFVNNSEIIKFVRCHF